MFHLLADLARGLQITCYILAQCGLHTNLTRMVMLLKRDSTPRGATVAGLALLPDCLTQSGAG